MRKFLGASLVVFGLLVAGSATLAQDNRTSPLSGFEGNWVVHWQGIEHPDARISVGAGDRMGCVRATANDCRTSSHGELEISGWQTPDRRLAATLTTDGGVTAKWPYGLHGHWGGTSKLTLSGSDFVTGRWEYGEDGGNESWRRVTATITSAEAQHGPPAAIQEGTRPLSELKRERKPLGHPVTLTAPYVGPDLTGPADRPEVYLNVYGEDLWGRHLFELPSVSGLTVRSRRYICDTGKTDEFLTHWNDQVCFEEGGVKGLHIGLKLWPGARPGLYVLTIDGQKVPFRLEITDFRDEVAPPVLSEDKVKIGIFEVNRREIESARSNARAELTAAELEIEAARRAVARSEERFASEMVAYRKRVGELNAVLGTAREALATAEAAGDAEAIRTATASLETEQRIFAIRLQAADAAIGDAATARHTAIAAVRAALDKRTAIDSRLYALELGNDRNLMQVSLSEAFLAKAADRAALLNEINASLNTATQALRRAEAEREHMRDLMLDASDTLTVKSDWLESAIMLSDMSQAGVEAALQIKDAIEAAKGGPAAFSLWTADRLYRNVFDPPKIYDPEPDLSRIQFYGQGAVEGYVRLDETSLKRTRDIIASDVGSSFKTIGRSSITQSYLRQQLDELGRKMFNLPAGSLRQPALAKQFQEQVALWDKARETVNNRMMSAGALNFAKAWGEDMLKSRLKSAMSESIKRAAAEFFSGSAWREYAQAQTDFGLAFRRHHVAVSMYWRNRDAVAALQAIKDALLEKEFNEDEGLLVERNVEFSLVDGLTTNVFFDGLQSTNGNPVDFTPYEGGLRVTLDGVPLTRRDGGNSFILDGAGATWLKMQNKRELDLEVTFE